MNKGRSWLVAVTVCALLMTSWSIPASAASPVTLTMSGPTVVPPISSHTYSGALSLQRTGLPMTQISIWLNGDQYTEVTTDAGGEYSALITFTSAGTYTVFATAFTGTPLETRSATLTVRTNSTLTVAKTGAGSGTITSSPAGINCGSTCSHTFEPKQNVTLTANAAAGSAFVQWSGGLCSGSGPCTVHMNDSYSVTARFDAVAPPPIPVVSGITPPSPANNNTPTITGTSQTGTTVRLFTNGTCTSTVAGTGAATGSGTFAITATVANNTTTTFFANAIGPAGNVSACSTTSVAYVEDSTGPGFAGLTEANLFSDTSIRLAWSAATDSVTPQASLQYDICRSTLPGACAASFVIFATTTAGAVTFIDGSLHQSTRYFYVVRARDQAGNRDGNTIERTAKSPGPSTIAVSKSRDHACALLDGGSLRCWGRNDFGQLGNGSTTNSTTPVGGIAISTATAIATGGRHSCALLADGTVRCWGDNIRGQSGFGDKFPPPRQTTTPITVLGLTSATAITAGDDHSCALLADSSVRCWGSDSNGTLGDGDPTHEGGQHIPVTVTGGIRATAIEAGADHTCALHLDGTMSCWGFDVFGQLGDGGDGSGPPHRTAPRTVGISNAIGIAAGDHHTCALLVGGSIKCWGDNTYGQVGDGFNNNRRHAPVSVTGITNAVAVAAGASTTCALLADGTVRCWGFSPGNGTSASSSTPVLVSGVPAAIAVEPSCLLLVDGTVRCWGSNTFGQLGNGSTIDSHAPVGVTGLVGPVGATTAAAGGSHSCTLLVGGSIRCWGRNSDGQLGDGTLTSSRTPVTVSGITDATDIAAGGRHSCAVLTSGSVRCWGRNFDGQLGDGTLTDRHTPVGVDGITNAVAIAAGDAHTCALLANATVRCWGRNEFGQLGNATFTSSGTPVTVGGITTAKSISVGLGHSCALLANGTVRCWGLNNSGQLGNGSIVNSSTPVAVGLTSVTAIAAANLHTCATLFDGTVRCWGNNDFGELGNGTTIDSLTPVTVTDISTAKAISLGNHYSCAVLVDGTLRCWGRNSSGQLGNGSTTNSSVPVTVSGLTGSHAVAGGGEHTCALLTEVTPRCWGNNGDGQLGDGTNTGSTTPKQIYGL